MKEGTCKICRKRYPVKDLLICMCNISSNPKKSWSWFPVDSVSPLQLHLFRCERCYRMIELMQEVGGFEDCTMERREEIVRLEVCKGQKGFEPE